VNVAVSLSRRKKKYIKSNNVIMLFVDFVNNAADDCAKLQPVAIVLCILMLISYLS